MPELRDDTTDDGFHEIQLSGKQLVFLSMAMTVVLIFTFLMGVRVGRDAVIKRGDEVADSSADAASAVPPSGTADAAPAAAEPPSPPAGDELSYHDRLQSNAATPEKPKTAQEQAKAEQAKAEPPAKEKPPPPAAPPAGVGVPTSGRPGTWVLQIVAVRNRAAGAELVQRLVAKGYPAFLENPPPGTPAVYRVRIGRYNDRTEADQVRRRLEKEDQLTSVITR